MSNPNISSASRRILDIDDGRKWDALPLPEKTFIGIAPTLGNFQFNLTPGGLKFDPSAYDDCLEMKTNTPLRRVNQALDILRDIDGDGIANSPDCSPFGGGEEQQTISARRLADAINLLKDVDGDGIPNSIDCNPLGGGANKKAEEQLRLAICLLEDIDGDGQLNRPDCNPFGTGDQSEAASRLNQAIALLEAVEKSLRKNGCGCKPKVTNKGDCGCKPNKSCNKCRFPQRVSFKNPTLQDSDNDGIPNNIDPPCNKCCRRKKKCGCDEPPQVCMPVPPADSDCDGVPNFMDPVKNGTSAPPRNNNCKKCRKKCRDPCDDLPEVEIPDYCGCDLPQFDPCDQPQFDPCDPCGQPQAPICRPTRPPKVCLPEVEVPDDCGCYEPPQLDPCDQPSDPCNTAEDRAIQRQTIRALQQDNRQAASLRDTATRRNLNFTNQETRRDRSVADREVQGDARWMEQMSRRDYQIAQQEAVRDRTVGQREMVFDMQVAKQNASQDLAQRQGEAQRSYDLALKEAVRDDRARQQFRKDVVCMLEKACVDQCVIDDIIKAGRCYEQEEYRRDLSQAKAELQRSNKVAKIEYQRDIQQMNQAACRDQQVTNQEYKHDHQVLNRERQFDQQQNREQDAWNRRLAHQEEKHDHQIAQQEYCQDRADDSKEAVFDQRGVRLTQNAFNSINSNNQAVCKPIRTQPVCKPVRIQPIPDPCLDTCYDLPEVVDDDCGCDEPIRIQPVRGCKTGRCGNGNGNTGGYRGSALQQIRNGCTSKGDPVETKSIPKRVSFKSQPTKGNVKVVSKGDDGPKLPMRVQRESKAESPKNWKAATVQGSVKAVAAETKRSTAVISKGDGCGSCGKCNSCKRKPCIKPAEAIPPEIAGSITIPQNIQGVRLQSDIIPNLNVRTSYNDDQSSLIIQYTLVGEDGLVVEKKAILPSDFIATLSNRVWNAIQCMNQDVRAAIIQATLLVPCGEVISADEVYTAYLVWLFMYIGLIRFMQDQVIPVPDEWFPTSGNGVNVEYLLRAPYLYYADLGIRSIFSQVDMDYFTQTWFTLSLAGSWRIYMWPRDEELEDLYDEAFALAEPSMEGGWQNKFNNLQLGLAFQVLSGQLNALALATGVSLDPVC